MTPMHPCHGIKARIHTIRKWKIGYMSKFRTFFLKKKKKAFTLIIPLIILYCCKFS